MGKRIKVTGYLYPKIMDPENVDLSDPTGLSERGFMKIGDRLGLDDIQFVLEDDD